ncbi:MAG: methylmalonyl-CoA mutase family protein [Chloroflexi bacterium]|nr:methylmalonyl-CoA mutase family protein [Chloroflexota bacterium]
MFDERWVKDFRQRVARWNEKGRQLPQQRQSFTTISGQEVKALYTPLDLAPADSAAEIGLPGEYPYLRGIHPTGYRTRLWTMRLFSGFGSAEESNRRYRDLLAHGQTGLSIAFDLPTLMGYDTDHPAAVGEFGKCGVGVSSLRDMEILLDKLPLSEITTSMTINSPAAVIWAMYIVAAEKQGVPRERLGGTLQNDILKEFIAQNEYVFPPQPSLKLVVDTIEFATREMPKWNSISVSGYHIREAGSTAQQELAFTLADGLAYVDAALERGLAIDDFAPRISFFFNSHNDFFEEIAKFRAARRIWARQMRERYGAESERSWWMRFHTQTAGCSLSAQQPENNIVRTALQALAAVLGGTQSLHTNSMDEALALPSELAARIALRTQQIIAHESGVTNTVDPLGGSYFVETLTNQMEQAVNEYFERIKGWGGVIKGIEEGMFQREIAEASFRYQQEVDRKERIIVGVNDFALEEPVRIPILQMDVEGEARQLERLKAIRRERDGRAVRQALQALREQAQSGANLMPPLLDAVRAYATLGETMDVLREVFGVYEARWAA